MQVVIWAIIHSLFVCQRKKERKEERKKEKLGAKGQLGGFCCVGVGEEKKRRFDSYAGRGTVTITEPSSK